MQLHPALISTLISERERQLLERAERRRAINPRERTVRSAPWPP